MNNEQETRNKKLKIMKFYVLNLKHKNRSQRHRPRSRPASEPTMRAPTAQRKNQCSQICR